MNKKLKETLIIEGVKFLFSWLGGLFGDKKKIKEELQRNKQVYDIAISKNEYGIAIIALEHIKKLEKEL